MRVNDYVINAARMFFLLCRYESDYDYFISVGGDVQYRFYYQPIFFEQGSRLTDTV